MLVLEWGGEKFAVARDQEGEHDKLPTLFKSELHLLKDMDNKERRQWLNILLGIKRIFPGAKEVSPEKKGGQKDE